MGILAGIRQHQELRRQFFLLLLLALLWSCIVGGSLAWSVGNEKEQLREMALLAARANFNKDYAFRQWAASHGGVYVPVSQRTPPNPYLSHVAERDISTPSGKRLTLMNPAYMLRQVMHDSEDLFGVKGHITSLKPLNPINAPSQWERRALDSFQEGQKEYFEFISDGEMPVLRLMRVLMAEGPCLKCHAQQGYQLGDVRGGVGVEVPLHELSRHTEAVIHTLTISHMVLWLLGLMGTVLAGGSVLRRSAQRIQDEEALRRGLREKEVMLAEIHHRVKNNLAIVSALLNLQAGAGGIGSPGSAPLMESQRRILSMGLVHEMLYRGGDLSSVSVDGYVRGLVGQISSSMPSGVRVEYEIDDIRLDLDTMIPLGLIISELVSNAFKHAFAGVQSPVLMVSFRRDGERLVLRVRDNGPGIGGSPEGETLGMQLVRTLTAQINGSLDIRYNGGAEVEVSFRPAAK